MRTVSRWCRDFPVGLDGIDTFGKAATVLVMVWVMGFPFL
jgi:hypothetical protein